MFFLVNYLKTELINFFFAVLMPRQQFSTAKMEKLNLLTKALKSITIQNIPFYQIQFLSWVNHKTNILIWWN